MTDILYNWLKYQWVISNHAKYQQYFKEWVDNLTENQIIKFNEMRLADYTIH